jgi:hypothetical protein
LEVLEAHLTQLADAFGTLDLFRSQRDAIASEQVDLPYQLSRAEGKYVELDDVGQLDQLLHPVPEDEVVKGERMAVGHEPSRDLNDITIDLHGLEDLQDDPIWRQGTTQTGSEKRVRDVDERPVHTDGVVGRGCSSVTTNRFPPARALS